MSARVEPAVVRVERMEEKSMKYKIVVLVLLCVAAVPVCLATYGPPPADVNCDARIDKADVDFVISAIVGEPVEFCCDVNADGYVNEAADLQLVLAAVAGETVDWNEPSVSGTVAIEAGDVNATPGSTARVPFLLSPEQQTLQASTLTVTVTYDGSLISPIDIIPFGSLETSQKTVSFQYYRDADKILIVVWGHDSSPLPVDLFEIEFEVYQAKARVADVATVALPDTSMARANGARLADAVGIDGTVTIADGADPADVNSDDDVNAIDVQLVINAVLGLDIDPYGDGDVDGDGHTDAVDVQLVINAVLGVR